MKTLKTLTMLMGLSLLISGCGTIATATGEKGEFGIYSGTHRSVENGFHTILDTPFSFVADTVLLPITIPVDMYRNSKNSTDEK